MQTLKQRTCPADQAVILAEQLLRESIEHTNPEEAASMERLALMIAHPEAKNFSFLTTDLLERSDDHSRTAKAWRNILKRPGTGSGFPLIDRILLRLGSWGSIIVPDVVIPSVRKRLRRESRGVILPAENPPLTRYLSGRQSEGTRVNLNQLGEAVLGEEEATNRLNSVLNLLERDDVDYVSVKISAIYSQINLVDWEGTLSAIKNRIRPLYRAAMARRKFVNLDMEEYRDLALTVRAFQDVLSEEEFRDFSAGMALQAYLPDSVNAQRELTDWAKERRATGGAPIKIRLVKGANLAMEAVEAELHGWNSAPHESKHETDACFKRMLEFACQPENAKAVHIGVGSHNLFDVALALVLRKQYGVEDSIEIEMLEGMAPAQSRVVRETADDLLVYAPVVSRENYGSALAYLIRRLDENTSPGNFLASLFSLQPGSEDWNREKDRFLSAWNQRHEITTQSNRADLPIHPTETFENEPDTDWTQAANRDQLAATAAPDLSPPRSGTFEIEAALKLAEKSQSSWAATSEDERADLLRKAAQQLQRTRFESIALLRDEGKKAPSEADSEVSEAIDFARYYAESGISLDEVEIAPLGTVVVASPWNFPFAIPCGGVLAALMAGNTVILKPAPESVRIAWWLVQQLWEAGIPRDALQFIACEDGEVGRRLIEDPRTSAVILTGAWETARRFQEWRPSLRLFAETSGKNALVVSSLADRELAAKDLVKSAFGHSGQKCSAASLGILEAEVYEDEVFLRQLRDAAASLKVGSADHPGSIVTPLVQPPNQNLLRALTTLDDGESWLLKPAVSPDDPCLWSPGIKIGVQPQSWFHETECFGPVLGLMRAKNLEHAIDIQNSGSFGLTAGLHTLDQSEISTWKKRVEAGNLYINRGITGAIVRRQPFGGWKNSGIGPGAKAGGPNYVNLFRQSRDIETISLEEAERDYANAWREHFARDHDPSDLRCESNQFRYRPRKGVLLRIPKEDPTIENLAQLASRQCNLHLIISRASEEPVEDLIARLKGLLPWISVLRTTGDFAEDDLLRAAARLGLTWIDVPLSSVGRLELTRWLQEQVVTETRHRYGNILI